VYVKQCLVPSSSRAPSSRTRYSISALWLSAPGFWVLGSCCGCGCGSCFLALAGVDDPRPGPWDLGIGKAGRCVIALFARQRGLDGAGGARGATTKRCRKEQMPVVCVLPALGLLLCCQCCWQHQCLLQHPIPPEAPLRQKASESIGTRRCC
jgi:hypothetical protein